MPKWLLPGAGTMTSKNIFQACGFAAPVGSGQTERPETSVRARVKVRGGAKSSRNLGFGEQEGHHSDGIIRLPHSDAVNGLRSLLGALQAGLNNPSEMVVTPSMSSRIQSSVAG